MLGPSFSPSIARIPGPASSHRRWKRWPWRRAVCTRARSCERAVSSGVSGAGVRSSSRGPRPEDRLLAGHAHRPRKLAADCVLGPSKETNSGPPNGWRSTTTRPGPGAIPRLREIAQHLRIGVRDAHEAASVAGLEPRASSRRAPRIPARGWGSDRHAGPCRVAELVGDHGLELIREHVLEDLGLVVHAVPRQVEFLRQKALEQSVAPEHLEREPAALVGQATPR